MTDPYDNTNRGAAFEPWSEQKFILQGKINIEGVDSQCALITAESKNGNKRIEVYQRIGVLFPNQKKKEGSDLPDYDGPLDSIHEQLRIAAWRKMKNDKPYMSLKVSMKESEQEKSEQPEKTMEQLDDEVPF